MIDLDDGRWATLTHAYGAADDIPALIRALSAQTGPAAVDSEPWNALWSSLCHQGDVFHASYAALPHIVAIGCAAPSPVDFGFFLLPAAIEIARASGNGPDVPDDLATSYGLGVAQLAECVAIHRNDEWDAATTTAATCALAVAKGHHRLAQVIMNLDDALIDELITADFAI